jgi:ribosomal-protein-alanine N-acetyltransferase
MQRFSPYTIRPMAQADIPAVVAIDRMSFSSPWPASSYAYELNQIRRSFYYVLLRPPSAPPKPYTERGWRAWLRGSTRESLVTGYVGLRLEDGHTHISTLAVHPAWRGRGLGEVLLLTSIQQTLDLRVAQVTLEVRASNYVAQRLYIKYGFHFTGVQPGYYRTGEDAWLMEAKLSGPEYSARLAKLSSALQERVELQANGVGQNTSRTV